MDMEQLGEEQLIQRFSHRPTNIISAGISIPALTKPSPIQRHAATSSIGLLDRLPYEILYIVLNDLDLQSLSRISCTSIRGQQVVQSLPAYHNLLEYAPEAMAALGETGLAGLHSIKTLYATLQSKQCISCMQYGPFLFLLTNERCCYECLWGNASLRVVPPALACKSFNLSRHHLRDLPILRNIPGSYSVGWGVSRKRRIRLISVKMAKRRALQIHGSLEQITRSLRPEHIVGLSSKVLKEWHTLRILLEAPLEPLGQDPSTLPSQGNFPNDRYCGMASAFFPSMLPDQSLDSGLWCLGCDHLAENYHLISSAQAESALNLGGLHPHTVTRGMKNRARSKAEFLEHILECYGARNLASVSE